MIPGVSPLDRNRRRIARKKAPPPSKKPIQKVNRKRKAREFARCYHSKERVEFVKSLPCVYCAALSCFFGDQTAGKCHNAHTENGGMGRKGDYTTIIPLCPIHHGRYDAYAYPFDKANQPLRDAMKKLAAEIEYLWQEYLAGTDA